MPQLAPMNWLFLILLFWTLIFLVSLMFWWMKDKPYYIEISKKKSMIMNKWTW